MLKTYVFRVELQEEDDERWSVWVPVLSGCTSWGNSKSEALKNIQEVLEMYIDDMLEKGEPLPSEAEITSKYRVFDSPSVAVAI